MEDGGLYLEEDSEGGVRELLDIFVVPSSLVRLVGRMENAGCFGEELSKWSFYAGATALEAWRVGEYYSRLIEPLGRAIANKFI